MFLLKAASERAPIVFADATLDVVELPADNALTPTTHFNVFQQGNLWLKNIELEAAGPFQQKNLATVLKTWELLQKQIPALDEMALRRGLRHLKKLTRFMGRWDIIGQNPTILCDSAHNEAGLSVAFEKIKSLHYSKIHLVTGFVNDKSVEGVLGLFPTTARYYFAKANIPRGLDALVLQEKAHAFGLQGRTYTSVPNALKAARRAAESDDLIVVIGSIFVVAEVI